MRTHLYEMKKGEKKGKQSKGDDPYLLEKIK